MEDSHVRTHFVISACLVGIIENSTSARLCKLG